MPYILFPEGESAPAVGRVGLALTAVFIIAVGGFVFSKRRYGPQSLSWKP